MPEPLIPLDRQWLEAEGVDPTDERITAVRPPAGGFGFDVATNRGHARVWYADDPATMRWRRPVGTRPWLIVEAPGKLAGTRYATAGLACRAALRGFPWPEDMPAEEERDFPTDLPAQTVSLPGSFIEEPAGEPVTFGSYERVPGRAAADDAEWRRSVEEALQADATDPTD